MLKSHQPSQISLGIMGLRLCVLFVLLGVTACQTSPMVSAPAASSPTASAPATATNAPATPTPFESQPVADGPVLLRAGLTLRKVLEVGANNIRLVRNPANGEVYLLNPAEGIFRVSDISGSARRGPHRQDPAYPHQRHRTGFAERRGRSDRTGIDIGARHTQCL